MFIDKLKIEELDEVLEILKQDCLRGYNGLFAESQLPWISNFLTNENCFSFGVYDDGKLIGVILSDRLSFKGCIVWYLATHPLKQGQTYGSALLDYFERYVKCNGVEWVFLNATLNSLTFYENRDYITSKFSIVHEHVKEL